MHFNPSSYGPAVATLLEGAKCNELGPGTPDDALRSSLKGLTPETIAAPHPLQDKDMALACIAGLWLRRDFLDESHRVSQDIENPTGSYWHGIMHRREGDFGNAKYWFRRVGKHPVFEPLAIAASQLAAEAQAHPTAGYLVEQKDWDPLAFVDLCQRALDGNSPVGKLCMMVQRREWELLFDDCYRRAIGA